MSHPHGDKILTAVANEVSSDNASMILKLGCVEDKILNPVAITACGVEPTNTISVLFPLTSYSNFMITVCILNLGRD